MKSIIYNIQKAFNRNALCLIALGVAMPAMAQDDWSDDGEAKAPKRPKVEQEKYQLKVVKGVFLTKLPRSLLEVFR